MIMNRLVGCCLAAISFILVGLVMSSRGSSTIGIEVMDRLGMVFVFGFLVAQIVICLIFLKRKDLLTPLLLFAGGTILYAVVTGVGESGRFPLYYALFAGTSFSGLATGLLLMIGEGTGETKG